MNQPIIIATTTPITPAIAPTASQGTLRSVFSEDAVVESPPVPVSVGWLLRSAGPVAAVGDETVRKVLPEVGIAGAR